MRHMLDTNIVSHLFKRHLEVVSRMTCLTPGDNDCDKRSCIQNGAGACRRGLDDNVVIPDAG